MHGTREFSIRQFITGAGGLTLLIAAVASVACGGASSNSLDKAERIEAFRDAATSGIDSDYEPLRSPAEAVEYADAIVVGRIVGASEARQYRDDIDGRLTSRFAVLDVSVEKVVSGSLRTEPGSNVAITTYISLLTPWEDIAATLPTERVLFILDDLADWDYDGRIDGFPPVVYFALDDGFWVGTEQGKPMGVFEDIEEMERRWDRPFDTLDAMIAVLEEAAR